MRSPRTGSTALGGDDAGGPALARWRRIQLTLEAELGAQGYRVGDRLPSEAALARRFGVNRHTVRRALARMVEKGLLSSERGRGTFVRVPRIHYPVRESQRFGETMRSLGWTPHRQVLGSRTVRADRQTARALEIGAGERVLTVESLDSADGKPISRNLHHFPLPRFRGIDEALRRTGSITAALQTFGVATYRRRQVRVAADKASQADIDRLGLTRADPVLQVVNTLVDDAGTPVHMVIGHWPARMREVVIDYEE